MTPTQRGPPFSFLEVGATFLELRATVLELGATFLELVDPDGGAPLLSSRRGRSMWNTRMGTVDPSPVENTETP